MNKKSILAMVLVAMAAVPAMANENDREIKARCHFEGSFSDKNGGFGVDCRAKIEFEHRDHDRSTGERRDSLELVCDGDKIYDDGVEVKVRHGNLKFEGKGRNAPTITINDFNGFKRPSDATLEFSRWGFDYVLNGSCRFEKEHDDN